VIKIKPCGIAYWLVTIFQVPFAVAFTAYIVYAKRNKDGRHDDEDGKVRGPIPHGLLSVCVAELESRRRWD
jgi:hypothetical protein